MGTFDEFARSFGGADEEEPEPQQPQRQRQARHDAISEVVDSLNDEDIDDELREAEKRLSKAAYYKQIVRSGIIEEDGTPEAAEINAEARLWARQRMVTLLKGEQPAAPQAAVESPFTDKEIMALKAVAGKVLLSQGEKPVDPVVKKIQTTPPAPTGPQVKTLKTGNKPKAQPEQRKQAAPAAPPAPAGKPPGKKPPPPAPAKRKFLRPERDDEGKIDYYALPMETPFEDTDGQIYKMIPHPDEDNRRIKRKITGQVKAVDAIPMPMTKHQIEAVSAAQAMATIDAGASASASSPFGSDQHVTPAHFVAAAALSQSKE